MRDITNIRSGSVSWFRRFGAGALIALLAVGALAGPASAHSELVSSNPANGATLPKSPTAIRLTFSDGVAPKLAVVTLVVGTEQPVRMTTTVVGDTVSALVPPENHTAGRWRVGYRIISVDGHPIEGQFGFKVLPAPNTPATPSVPPAEASASDAEATSDRKPAKHTDSTPPPSTLISILVLAGLMSVPVGWFVLVANKKRREDAEANRRGQP